MQLTTEDMDLFYKLNWSLLFYVNQKFKVIADLKEPNFKKEKLINFAMLAGFQY